MIINTISVVKRTGVEDMVVDARLIYELCDGIGRNSTTILDEEVLENS
jgi:hypothetical protein